jgi:hypothetical protein
MSNKPTSIQDLPEWRRKGHWEEPKPQKSDDLPREADSSETLTSTTPFYVTATSLGTKAMLKKMFDYFNLKPANKLYSGARYVESAAAIGAIFNADAARQKSESVYFSDGEDREGFQLIAGGNPASATSAQAMAAYRHLSEGGFVSRSNSGSDFPLLKKFRD